MKTILNTLLTVILLSGVLQNLSAQDTPVVVTQKKLKVVIQLASEDTLVHKAMFRQFENFRNAAPNARIEVVCHNNGLSFLNKKGPYAKKVEQFAGKGIDFVACENTMKQRNVKRDELIDGCRLVPAGLVEIVMKQDQKWAYIKAGF
jgi:uncharacterized protein